MACRSAAKELRVKSDPVTVSPEFLEAERLSQGEDKLRRGYLCEFLDLGEPLYARELVAQIAKGADCTIVLDAGVGSPVDVVRDANLRADANSLSANSSR